MKNEISAGNCNWVSQSLLLRQLRQERVEREGTHLSHELFSSEDEFVVDEPAWLFLKQGAVGVHVYGLLMLHRFVASFTESRGVVEVARCHSLPWKNNTTQH